MLRHIDAPDQEYLTIKQASDWLGVPANTIKAWWEGGHIPAPVPMQGERFLRYSWRVVFAIRVWIECGRLPPEALEGIPKEVERSRKKAKDPESARERNIDS